MTNSIPGIITRAKAIALVQHWLDSRNADPLAFEKLVIDEKLTVERDGFYGVYYRPEEPAPSVAPGLLIVDKQDGKLYNTVGSTWYNWLREFEQYKLTGHSEIDWSRSEVMEREVQTLELPQRELMIIRAHVKHEEKEQRLRQLLHTLRNEIQHQGLTVAGNPEMVQRDKNEFGSSIEVRIAYTGKGKANDTFELGTSPPLKLYCTVYTGNYYDFVGALHELKRFGRVNGIKEKGEPWVEYLAYDLQQLSDTWVNRICVPIE